MTVAALINELAKYPADAVIVLRIENVVDVDYDEVVVVNTHEVEHFDVAENPEGTLVFLSAQQEV